MCLLYMQEPVSQSQPISTQSMDMNLGVAAICKTFQTAYKCMKRYALKTSSAHRAGQNAAHLMGIHRCPYVIYFYNSIWRESAK